MAGSTDRDRRAYGYGSTAVTSDLARSFSRIGLPVVDTGTQLLDLAEDTLTQSFPFRSYAISTPPDGFGHTTVIFVESARILHPHSHTVSVQEKEETGDAHEGSTYFAKGNFFEQEVGIGLAFLFPDTLIVPQICLNVTPGRFETRADFLILHENALPEVVEVKYGRDKEGISETLNRHNGLLAKGKVFPHISGVESDYYHLITLVSPNGNSSFRYELFDTILERFGEDPIASQLHQFGEMIKKIPDKTAKSRAKWLNNFLSTFQTYLYNILDRANQYTGEMRRAYLRYTMGELSDVWEESKHTREELQNFIAGKMDNTFTPYRPLEAHYMWNGRLYRGSIGIHQLENELAKGLEVVCELDGVALSPQARDLALLIEMSPHKFSFQDFFSGHPGKVYRSAVFVLPERPEPLQYRALTLDHRIGSHGAFFVRGVRLEPREVAVLDNLEDVLRPEILGVSPEDFFWYMNQYRPYLDQLDGK